MIYIHKLGQYVPENSGGLPVDMQHLPKKCADEAKAIAEETFPMEPFLSAMAKSITEEHMSRPTRIRNTRLAMQRGAQAKDVAPPTSTLAIVPAMETQAMETARKKIAEENKIKFAATLARPPIVTPQYFRLYDVVVPPTQAPTLTPIPPLKLPTVARPKKRPRKSNWGPC